MNTKHVFQLALLAFFITPTAYANEVMAQPKATNAQNAQWSIGQTVLEDRVSCELNNKRQSERCLFKRVFLGMTPEGHYQVQDYFRAFKDKKYTIYTNPYVLNDKDAVVKNIDFESEPQYVVGEYIGWHLNGQMREKWKTENEKLEDEKISWYDDGQKRRTAFYQNGEQKGNSTQWFRFNGKKSSEYNCDFDRTQCTFTSWYLTEGEKSDQKIEEIHYQNSVKNGLSTFWYKNGQKWSEVHYTNGLREGQWLWWYPNGQLMREEHFKKGIKEGVWLSWDEQGNPTETEEYQNDINTKYSDKVPLMSPQKFELDNDATQKMRWKAGAIITDDILIVKTRNEYFQTYRVFLGATTQPGYCAVQDFYQDTQQKYTDPFLMLCEYQYIKSKMYIMTYDGIYGNYIVWYCNGQRALETTYTPVEILSDQETTLYHKKTGLSRAWDDTGKQISERRQINKKEYFEIALGTNSLTSEEALEIGMQEAVKAGWKYEKIYEPHVNLDSLEHWTIFFTLAPSIDDQGREIFLTGGHGMITLSLDGERSEYTPGL